MATFSLTSQRNNNENVRKPVIPPLAHRLNYDRMMQTLSECSLTTSTRLACIPLGCLNGLIDNHEVLEDVRRFTESDRKME